ncbi:MAG: cytochrome-c peroxidase [Bacteroidia bacterium]|nr:cytochrome-c peroxidase [Bacteroidia bacterium]
MNACEVDPIIKEELPANDIRFSVPQGWPQPVYDYSTNPLTTEGFVLGRKLFYDTRLSRNNTISCGSCHQQFAAFSHLDHAVSHGIDGLLGTRNAPGLYNLNWHPSFMWDGGVNHLEVQPLAPIDNPVEMDEDINNVVVKLQNDADYRRLFREAFGTETITTPLILKAMAQFQGMLVSANSKYDRYMRGETSLSASELNGLNLFQQKCNSCHTAPLFSNFQYMNNGLDSVFADAGRARITLLAADSGTFKVPSLRNVGLTRQYMHDGRFNTLEQVLDHYSSGVVNSSTISAGVVGGIPMTAQEKQDIIAFLKTLSDYSFINDRRFADPFAP